MVRADPCSIHIQYSLIDSGLRASGKKADLIGRLVTASQSSLGFKRQLHVSGNERNVRQKKKNIEDEHIASKINDLFDMYKDSDNPDEMTDDGIFKFLRDVQVDPQVSLKC